MKSDKELKDEVLDAIGKKIMILKMKEAYLDSKQLRFASTTDAADTSLELINIKSLLVQFEEELAAYEAYKI